MIISNFSTLSWSRPCLQYVSIIFWECVDLSMSSVCIYHPLRAQTYPYHEWHFFLPAVCGAKALTIFHHSVIWFNLCFCSNLSCACLGLWPCTQLSLSGLLWHPRKGIGFILSPWATVQALTPTQWGGGGALVCTCFVSVELLLHHHDKYWCIQNVINVIVVSYFFRVRQPGQDNTATAGQTGHHKVSWSLVVLFRFLAVHFILICSWYTWDQVISVFSWRILGFCG